MKVVYPPPPPGGGTEIYLGQNLPPPQVSPLVHQSKIATDQGGCLVDKPGWWIRGRGNSNMQYEKALGEWLRLN